MASIYPKLWSNPIRYFRWAAHEKPAIFFASILGAIGPIALFTVPPLREKFGDPNRARIPMTYPIPQGTRKIPDGYDDPKE